MEIIYGQARDLVADKLIDRRLVVVRFLGEDMFSDYKTPSRPCFADDPRSSQRRYRVAEARGKCEHRKTHCEPGILIVHSFEEHQISYDINEHVVYDPVHSDDTAAHSDEVKAKTALDLTLTGVSRSHWKGSLKALGILVRRDLHLIAYEVRHRVYCPEQNCFFSNPNTSPGRGPHFPLHCERSAH